MTTTPEATEATTTGTVGKCSDVDAGSGENIAVGEDDVLDEAVGDGDGVGRSGSPCPIGVYCSFVVAEFVITI